MNMSLTVSLEGDGSREARFTLEPLHEGVTGGTWTVQQQSGFGVLPNNGMWSYVDYAGEIWLNVSEDVFGTVRVSADWANALLGGTTVMGQGWFKDTSQGNVNVYFRLEAG